MSLNIFRETSPLDNRDCFVVFERQKTSFTFPIHIHPEYEFNYVGLFKKQRVFDFFLYEYIIMDFFWIVIMPTTAHFLIPFLVDDS